MRVGLIGIPGSGKTKLALRVWNTLQRDYDLDLAVIDKYVEPLIEDLDIDIGPNSTYKANLLVAMEREKKELKLRKDREDYIVCGTTIDSASYTAALIESIAALGMQLESMQAQVQKEITGMTVLTALSIDLVNVYDRVFYLPPPKSANLIVPGSDRGIDPQLLAVDAQMKAFFEYTSYPHVVLDKTLDENVEKVIECLQLSGSGVSSSEPIS